MNRLFVFLILSILISCGEKYYPPEITIISPRNKSLFVAGDTVVIEAEVWCDWNTGIERVYFNLDGIELGMAMDTIYPYRYELDTKWLRAGGYSISAKVIDMVWGSACDQITILLKEETAVTD